MSSGCQNLVEPEQCLLFLGDDPRFPVTGGRGAVMRVHDGVTGLEPKRRVLSPG
ncbi:hypothetical protein [Salinibacterium xinjiangense]|uniref:hypothetical protein n=1 Tax=Salinibacterium xinjiangense TaxID=386302 RepID=UPI001C5471D4|nr:hypothetical protein [Salinibacterium xinjiangense]